MIHNHIFIYYFHLLLEKFEQNEKSWLCQLLIYYLNAINGNKAERIVNCCFCEEGWWEFSHFILLMLFGLSLMLELLISFWNSDINFKVTWFWKLKMCATENCSCWRHFGAQNRLYSRSWRLFHPKKIVSINFQTVV